jgi:hypothetical protein
LPVRAYVLVKTKPGTSHQLLASRKITGVKMADSVFGKYDVVLAIEAEDMEDLASKIYDVVEKHSVIEHTEVLVSIPWSPPEEKVPTPERDMTAYFNCPSCNSPNVLGATYCHFCGFVFSKPSKKRSKAAPSP